MNADMARLADTTETGHQEPEPSTKTASKSTARRESYIAGEPDSAPELVQFMKCKNNTDIDNISSENLLIAVTQAS